LRNGELYIHPETKVLTRYRKVKTKAQKKEPCFRPIPKSKRSFLTQYNGIWYRIDYCRDVGTSDFGYIRYCGQKKKSIFCHNQHYLGNPEHINPAFADRFVWKTVNTPEGPRYTKFLNLQHLDYKKKQLSSKELRHHKLKNNNV
jgi:hypothetical protein